MGRRSIWGIEVEDEMRRLGKDEIVQAETDSTRMVSGQSGVRVLLESRFCPTIQQG